ncbi:hypothetical protein HYS47_00010 [Candidatus Woesearchaeota archaeon]|nr:hypothetical protein [Candidatus Woesearchaeota archaeon]
MKRSRTTLAAALATTLAAVCLTTKPAEAAWVRAEAFASAQGIIPDIKAATDTDIGPANAAYFFRNRASVAYDGTAKNFMLHELGLGELYGFRALLQGIIPETEVIPRAGVSYHATVEIDKDMALSIFTAVVSSMSSSPIVEWLTIPSFRMPGISERGFGIDLEHLLWANQDSVTGAIRARIGHEILDGFSAGIGTETDYGVGQKPTAQVGGYVRFEK